MQKEGNVSAKDRRTALDLAIICGSMGRAQGRVRLIPRSRVPVDALTQDDITKCNAALFELMAHGKIVLIDERSEVQGRRNEPELKGISQSASRRQLESRSALVTWEEFRDPGLAASVVCGGEGGVGSSSSPFSRSILPPVSCSSSASRPGRESR
eukprot:4723481-Pyramimonas_sp.AAC.1